MVPINSLARLVHGPMISMPPGSYLYRQFTTYQR